MKVPHRMSVSHTVNSGESLQETAHRELREECPIEGLPEVNSPEFNIHFFNLKKTKAIRGGAVDGSYAERFQESHMRCTTSWHSNLKTRGLPSATLLPSHLNLRQS